MDALYGAIVVVLFPYALVRFLTDHKTRARWRAYGKDLPTRYRRRVPRPSKRPAVWVHGVSVGEVKSVARLVRGDRGAVPRPGPDHLGEYRHGPTHRLRAVSEASSRVLSAGPLVDRARRVPGAPARHDPPGRERLLADLARRSARSRRARGAGERPPERATAGRRGTGGGRSCGTCSATLVEVCVQLEVYAERFLSLGVLAGARARSRQHEARQHPAAGRAFPGDAARGLARGEHERPASSRAPRIPARSARWCA